MIIFAHKETEIIFATLVFALCTLFAANAGEFRSSSFAHVWDAAEGLRENVNSGGHVNPYTMTDGAIWGYYKSATPIHTSTDGLVALPKATAYSTDTAWALM